MSGASRKTGRRVTSLKNASRDIGDVTLNDFANCSISCGKGRLKKGASNSVVREVKQLSGEGDTRAWYEKLEDFEDEFEFVEEDAEDGSTAYVIRRPQRRKKKTISEENCDYQDERREYPIDLWFRISEYIKPEDIATFACLCSSAYLVVKTAKFWYHLYRRYYKTVPNLPEFLEPECMVRLYGLRTCVIRALHFMYPPFVNKQKAVKEVTPNTTLRTTLTKRQCVLMWHQKFKSQWIFYFKLKHNAIKLGRGSGVSHQPDLIEMLEDISANQEEGCKVLQVTCQSYIPHPIVIGQTLCDVAVTLSTGLCSYRMQLEFGSGPMCYTGSNSVVVFDPVVSVKILDWWHPLYPHINSLGIYLQQQQQQQLLEDTE